MQKVLQRILSFGLAIAMCFGITTVVNSTSVEPITVNAATDYYASITATGGNALLGQVHDLITTTHTKYTSYNDCKDPEYIKKTDPGSSSSYVMEFYSQADISATWGSGAVGTWNREHCWCQSLSNGLWGETGGGSDLHHLRPVESRLNSTRGNNKYGVVSNRDSNKAYYKDAKGNNVAHAGYNGGGTFEPLDNVKGDVARIILYMYTHYNKASNVYGTTNGNGNASYFGTLNFTNIISATSESAAISLLLEWNESDPVDQIEITRNEAVYSIQGNRNPFVDHPEYADAIWGDSVSVELQSLSLNPSSFTLSEGKSQAITVTPYPSIASASVNWTSSNDAVATVSAGGMVTAKSEGTATITATSTVNPSIKATAQVTVKKSSYTIATITLDSFNLTYGYGFKDWSTGDISGIAYIYGGSSAYPQTGKMQFNKNQSSYYLASNTPTNGAIKSVTVNLYPGETERNWKLLTSNTPYGQVAGKPTNGTDQGTKTVTAEGTTWEVRGEDKYFALTYEFPSTGTSAAAYLDSIIIEFSNSGETHIHNYTAVGSNNEQHWNYCPDDNQIDSTSYANHIYVNGVCTVCKYAHTNHVWSNGTCTVCGSVHANHVWSNGTCSVCGSAHTGHTLVTVRNNLTHWEECSICYLKQNESSHNIAAQGKNVDGHWNYCTDCGYVNEATRGEHSFVYDAEAGKELCSECGYTKGHEHTLEWKSDKTGHWQQCTECDHIENTTEHTWSAWVPSADGATHSRNTICSIEHEKYTENAAHNYVNGVCADCGFEHANHEYRDGVCGACGHKHENHVWAKGICTVCGAQDPDFTPDEEDTKLQEFHNAVVNIVTNGTLQERLNSINKAIVAYQALSDEQKALAEEDIAALKEAINDYNETINSLNEEAEKANNAATNKSGAARG